MSDLHPTHADVLPVLPVLIALGLIAPTKIGAQEPWAFADGNELACLIDNRGGVCNPQGPGGGVWPAGSLNQYVYDAGLVVAGLVGEGASASWVGDTIPAFFFDHRGTRNHGSPVSNVFSSARARDLGAWPRTGDIAGFPLVSATIETGDPFSAVYLGREVASELDTWTLYWEGDPTLNAGRPHPLGVAVEQRTMQWSGTGPEGLQSVMFIVYRVSNVTNLPTFRDLIADRFFDGDTSAVPAGGWTLDSVFVGFNADFDVALDASSNMTVLLPSFAAAGAYHASFESGEYFQYPPEIFHPPFFTDAPGIVASALVYADAPGEADAEARIVSEWEGGGCFGCDSNGAQLWRMLSGHTSAFDLCAFQDPLESGICNLRQVPHDAKSYQSVGPWNLAPGAAATVVYAIVVAPTVDVPEIVQGAENPPGIPSFAPGCDGNDILPIERAAGWVSTPLCPTPGERVDPDLVETVPGSLLHRIQVARAFAANGFLTPLAPERPDFHLVATDSAVHVVWQRSATETASSGDPYHDVASDTANALYNPNYRSDDVEGYRVYRSIDRVNWQLLAQYDYADTHFTDALCETDPTHVTGAACTDTTQVRIYDHGYYAYEIGTYFVQYRPGDILEAATGQPIIVDGDTASAGFLPLLDREPVFLHTDADVRAGFRYFYQVRAFDVNSYRSGPSSLESVSATKSIVIQADFANRVDGSLSIRLEGADGTPLDPNAALPTIDAETGVFSGPMPPTNGIEPVFQPILTDLMPGFRLEVTIDSVNLVPHDSCPPGVYGGGSAIPNGPCWHMHLTTSLDGEIERDTIVGFTPLWDSFGEAGAFETWIEVARIDADSARMNRLDGGADDFGFDALLHIEADEAIWNSTFEGQSNRRGTSALHAGGSRWFDGTEETEPHPTTFIRVGDLAGMDTIWSPDVHHTPTPTQALGFDNSANMQWWGYTFSQVARAADFRVTWQNGTITVEDVTHHVPVPFDPTPTGQSWAFVPDGNDNGMIDDYDFFYLSGAADLIASNAMGLTDPASAEPGVASPVLMPTSIQGVQPLSMVPGASGFGLLINTQRFIFRPTDGQLPANGTVWTLRTYHGLVTATNANTTDPSGYSFIASGTSGGVNGILQLRPPFVPGLRVVFEGTASRLEGAADLARIHAVPDPYYFHSVFGATEQDRGRVLRFVNLPPQATIRIYSVAGILVDVIHHDDPASGIATWDLQTRDGVGAASGVYFFHVVAPGAEEHLGRFTIVTSGRYVD